MDAGFELNPASDVPPADVFSPRSSFISNASFCGFVELDLDIYFKQVCISRICKSFIEKEMQGDQYMDIGIDVHGCKEFIQVPQAMGDRRRFKLNCMTQYKFEADADALKTLSEKPLFFRLFIINEKDELCLGEAKLYIGNLLEDTNKKVDGSILFSNEKIELSDNVACLEIWYEFRCNKEEVLEYLTKSEKNHKKLPKFQVIDPEAGDFLLAASEIKLETVSKIQPWCQHDANIQTLNLDAEVCKPEVSITIVQLYFMEGSTPMKNDSIDHIYVEYSFLGQDGAEMESPFSIPVGSLQKPSEFHWTKSFDLDIKSSYENCRLLMKMLSNRNFVKFAVISEPMEVLGERIQMCEEVGYAEVLLEDIVKLERNVDSYQYEIFDVHQPLSVIGYMTVEFQGIFAMKNLVACFTSPEKYYESEVFA